MESIRHQEEQIIATLKYLNNEYRCCMTVHFSFGRVVVALDDQSVRFMNRSAAVHALHTAPKFGSRSTMWSHLRQWNTND